MQITVLADHLDLPESVRWRDGEIWFVDGGKIKVLGNDRSLRVHATIDCPVLLGLSFTPQGGVLTSDAVRRRVYSVSDGGRVEVFADLSAHTPYMLNEAALMADDSVVVGDIGFDVLQGAAPQAAQLLRIAGGGKVSRTGAPTSFSNGLIVIEGGSGLLAAETVTGKIRRYRLLSHGLDEGTVIATVDIRGLDGIGLSPDGTLWCADIESGQVVQVDSDGAEMRRVNTGFPNATSCVTDGSGNQVIVTTLSKRPDSLLKCDGALLSIVV